MSTLTYIKEHKKLIYTTIGLLTAFTLTLVFSGETEKEKEVRLEREVRILKYDKFRANAINEAREEIKKLNECINLNSKNIGEDTKGVQCVVERVKTASGAIKMSFSPIPEVSANEEKIEEKQKPLTPKELFYTTKLADKCYVSQSEKEHFKSNGRLATDVACGGRNVRLFAPDYNNKVKEYKIERHSFKDTGNTLLLRFEDNNTNYFWLIGHISDSEGFVDNEIIKTGERIGWMDMSGISSGFHSHIELWQGNTLDDAVKVSYSSSTRALTNMRQGKLMVWDAGAEFYFTHYDLGDVNQNDSAPCHGASGKNLCELENKGIRTMALTKDVRDSYGIKFGDKVKLIGDDGCAGEYEVHDEMNQRFRYGEVMRENAPIKGDLPSKSGGKCKVEKI